MLQNGDRVKKPVQTKLKTTNRFGHTDAWIVSQIPQETDVIGINAPFTDSRLALYPLIQVIKQRFPDTQIVVGGILATTLSHQVLTECRADIVVKGEGEIAFSRILNGDPLEQIPGLLFRRKDGSIFENPQRSEQLRTIDQIPQPGYDFRPMKEYVAWSPRGNKSDRTLSVISSRGCPFACQFCSIPEKGTLWRPFTPERVLDEIRMAIEKWNVNIIEFEDDNFTLKESRALVVLEYLRDLRKGGYEIGCTFPNGIMIDKMSKELAVLMAEAGCEIANLPVESGDTRTLIAMDKPMAEEHLEKTLKVARWCVEAGLFTSCFFIVGYPGGFLTERHKRNKIVQKILKGHQRCIIDVDGDGRHLLIQGEDEESFENTIRFCRKLLNVGVQGITPLIATPYPGTEMYKVAEEFGWLAFEDNRDVLTTVSYAGVTPDCVQLSTPWCSQQRVFDRWQEMMAIFPTVHNVRKKTGRSDILSGDDIRRN